jgi:Tfp pilus assembly protein PilN
MDIVGLALGEDHIGCVALRRRLGRTRVLGAFGLAVGEDVGAALRAKLREMRVRGRRVHVGLPRRRAVVKVIELPAVAGADLRRMVGFELERHLPFPANEALYDFQLLEQAPGRPVRVLLVAIERRVFDRVGQLLREAGLVPRLVDISIHGVALLAAPSTGSAGGARVVAGLAEAEAEVTIIRGGRLLGSRSFPLPPEPKDRTRVMADEIRRTLSPLRTEDRQAVTEVVVTGGGPGPGVDWTDLPVRTDVALPAGLQVAVDDPSLLPALAMALRRPGRGPLRTSLVPDEVRPRPFPWPLAATAALAGITVLLALAIPALTLMRNERQLAALTHRLADLAPRVREVEQLAAGVERARREVETLRSFEGQHIRVLPILRELTEVLPQDVWLTNLSVDRKGVELAGFANAASQLIPLLEGSPTFDRVEFTSPVTKGRDREQFRLKTGLEAAPGSAAAPAPPAAAPTPPPPAPRPPRRAVPPGSAAPGS